MTDRLLTTYEYDPAVPSKNPRIGDGPPTPEQLAEYRKMYPGRGYAGRRAGAARRALGLRH
jgi:hypothetical protein